MVDFQEANRKFLDGDGITDEELQLLIEFYEPLEQKLSALGERFYLARSEIFHRLTELQAFAMTRLQEKERYQKVARPVK